jgi:hypothetical protein
MRRFLSLLILEAFRATSDGTIPAEIPNPCMNPKARITKVGAEQCVFFALG